MLKKYVKTPAITAVTWMIATFAPFSYGQGSSITIAEDTVVDSESNPYESGEVIVDGATLFLKGSYLFDEIKLINGAKIKLSETEQGESPNITISASDFYLGENARIDISGVSDKVGHESIPVDVDVMWPVKEGAAGIYAEVILADINNDPEGIEHQIRSYGGGVFVLQAIHIEINGQILANASEDMTVPGDGGGGGSIALRGETMKVGEDAVFSAKGASSGYTSDSDHRVYGRGGQGGHIALSSATEIQGLRDLIFDVSGGPGRSGGNSESYGGGAGSVYIREYREFEGAYKPHTRLLVENKREVPEESEADPSVFSVFLRSWDAKRWNFDQLEIKNSTLNIVLTEPGSDLKVQSDYIRIQKGGLATSAKVESDELYLIDGSSMTPTHRSQRLIELSEVYTTVDVSAKKIYIDETSSLSATAFGAEAAGPVPGSHGGYGGSDEQRGLPSGNIYGDFRDPVDPGSSYARTYYSYLGGGVVKVQAGELRLDGSIQSDGEWSSSSGGSVNLTVDSIIFGPSSLITASAPLSNGTGGGGGRVAVSYLDSNIGSVSSMIEAYGGSSQRSGGAGTVYIYDRKNDRQSLIVDNGTRKPGSEYNLYPEGPWSSCTGVLLPEPMPKMDIHFLNSCGYIALSGQTEWPEYSGESHVNSITVYNSQLEFSEPINTNSITISSSTLFSGTGKLALASQFLSIDEASAIDLSGLGGDAHAEQPLGEGGSHGGLGGNPGGHSGLGPFGSEQAPIEVGRGGAGDSVTPVRGGGAVRIDADTIQVDGRILAEGDAATDPYTGGGAGGSVYITVNQFFGTNVANSRISVNGGAGGDQAGGGGGGRISLVAGSIEGWPSEYLLSALGGSGLADGGAGTIYVEESSERPIVDIELSLQAEGDGQTIDLTWPGAEELGIEEDIYQYHFYVSTEERSDFAGLSPWDYIDGDKSSDSQGVFSRGEQIYVAIRAINEDWETIGKSEFQAVTPVDIIPPNPVVRLYEPVPVVGGIEASWINSDSDYDPATGNDIDISGYRVELQTAEGGDLGKVQTIPHDSQAVRSSARFEGVSPATRYRVVVTSFDEAGNVSTPTHFTVTSLISNPTGLTGEAGDGSVALRWNPISELDLLYRYSVYVSESPFSDISGMSNRVSLSPTLTEYTINGLENGKTYYVAITSVNVSKGENPNVTTIEVTPEADQEGPEITRISHFDGDTETDLAAGATITRNGSIRVYAEDPSGVSRFELSVDGAAIGTDLSSGTSLEVPWNLKEIDDGTHELGLKVLDTLNNETNQTLSVNVALEPPEAPVIVTPKSGLTTNESTVKVTGRSADQINVRLLVNGSLQGEPVATNGQGDFSLMAELIEGENLVSVEAAHLNRSVYSSPSEPVTINLDSSQPDAPQGLTANSKTLGEIALGWSYVEDSKGYNVYRSLSPFEQVADAERVNEDLIGGTTYRDLPTEDGEYHYRVVALNELGTESLPSNPAGATSDSTTPQATKIRYTPHGSHDPATGRYGPGQIDVEVEVSEPLKTTPYLALTVSGGQPMVAELRKDYGSDTLYTGGFVIPETAISGTAMAVFSAHDKVGNRGTEVLEGSTLVVDAKGPEVSQLTLNPNSPIQNDPDESGLGRTLDVSLTLADDVMGGEMPQLVPFIVTENGEEVIADYASGITLAQDAASQPGNPVYTGQLQLPVSAGQDENGAPTSELLGFRYLARDDLGNEIDRIAGNPRFQVYQGDLPPVETPTGLKARALPGGKVELIWSDMDDAAGYRIYRQAPGEADLSEREQLDYPAEMLYLDGEGSPLLDGQYQYAIASLRAQNGQTSESAMSDPVSVNADATPPDAPENLSLELNGAGVVARWQPPASEVQDGLLEYNLYRVDLPADSQPTDMQAYTPYQNGIPDIIALDSRPSDTEHLYVVTAVDAAGNESVASNAEYLNVDLLPVSDLNITLPEGGQPALSWDHSKASAVAFEVYDANASEDVPLHEGTVADRQYVDGSYSTAEEGGAPTDRLYRVVAVDTNGVASVGHDLLLPALSTTLNRDESGIDLRRGIMNRVSFRVANAGASNVVQARLRVTVDDDGTAREHWSERFSVDPGGFTDVPVVIGGYDKLPTLAPMAVDIVLTPKAGQSITIQQSEEIQVGQSGLVATLEAEDFVRGATGKVRLVLENPSDVETEVLMARSSGKQASNELRLTLKDHDGNTLSEQAVKQATGDVITLSNGATVARIPPNGTYRSQPLEIPVPSSAPDSVRVHLQLDHFRYHTGRDTYVAIEGTRASRDVSLKETPYYGELAEVTPATVFTGDSVTIKGQALDRQSDTTLPNVPLTLVLTTRGIERTFPVYTGADGTFSYTFTPGSSESGEYRVSVLHPRMVERPEHGTFIVEGAGVTPTRAEINIPRNYEYELKIRVKAGHATELENARLVYAPSADSEGNPLPAPQGMQYNLGAPKQVQANQTAYLPLTFSGDASAADEGALRFHVVADNRAQPLDTVTVNYFLSEARPVMLAQPSLVNTGVSLGQSQQETVTLENTGLESAYNLNLSLVTENGDPAPDWFRLLSPANIGSLAVGNTAEVQVALSPDAQVPPNDYVFMVRVAGDNIDTFDVPVLVAATNADTGSVFFHTTDIYTATLDENMDPIPGLGNVKIKLQNTRVLSEEFELKTDADGFGELKDIPAGRYAYRASAFDHESVSGHLWVKPGVTTNEQLFLMNALVNVEFSVTEITLEDRYDIVLKATYETNVPVPVVLFEPMSVNLPMLEKGQVFQGEFTLTNHGMIEAYDVTATLPKGDDYARFDYLTEIPDVLSPGQVVRVPYRIVALQDFEPSGDGEATGGGCVRREYKAICDYSAQCAVGTIIDNVATMFWNAVGGNSCGGGGGSGGNYGGGFWGGYGGYGGGGVNYSPAPRGEVTVDDEFCPEDCEYCCGNGSGGAGGSGPGSGGLGGGSGGMATGIPQGGF